MNKQSNERVIQWLLEPSNPSMRYRTLTEILLYADTDAQVLEAQSAIYSSKDVQHLLEKMHPEGYWLQKNPRTKKVLGDGVAYGSFATTHFILSYLAELGLTKAHKDVARAAERYLNLQAKDGDWWLHMSCLIGYNIHTFIKLGYKNDDRVKQAVDYLLLKQLPDGGYLCDMHEKKYKTKFPKSCVRGSAKALLAFSYLPQYFNHPRVVQLVDYFLNRHGIFKSNDHNTLVNKDMQRLTYPITWQANSWEILLALSKMGYGKDKRLKKAWQYLNTKTLPNGRYPLDYTPGQAPWKVGKKGEENKWISFYILLAEKFKEQISK